MIPQLIERSMQGFHDTKTVMYEKDRTMHPVMGFKVVRLWNPPYLQVAIDIPDINAVKAILKQIPQSDHLIIEASTPLIKRYGVEIVQSIREVRPNAFVISGLALVSTIEKAIKDALKAGADIVVV